MNRRGPSRSWGRKRNDSKSRPQQREQQSFHRRNFRIVAAPLLFIFSLLRTVALQLWIVLGILVCKGSAIAGRSSARSSRHSERDAEAGAPMNQKSRNTPGPGEPILATQKHHHRKAFEYISKALKIDEEDAGLSCYVSFPDHNKILDMLKLNMLQKFCGCIIMRFVLGMVGSIGENNSYHHYFLLFPHHFLKKNLSSLGC